MREQEVGTIIRKYREMQGLSADELAEKLHIWNRYVPLWEHGLALPDAAWQKDIVTLLQIPSPDAEIVLKEKPVLNIDEEELVIPGLQKEYCFLQLSDAHVILPDEDSSEARIDYETPRIQAFTEDNIPVLERMDAVLAYIQEHSSQLDGVLLTGDIIDCPFINSIQYLKEFLEKLPVPYMYVPGNHDWRHFDTYEEEIFKRSSYDCFNAFTNGNPRIHQKRFGELTMIGVDNTIEAYEPGIADALEQSMKNEENVLLLQHIPFHAPTLSDDCRLWWHGNDISVGMEGDLRNDNVRVLNMITAEDSPVKAVITGHLHFHHKDLLKGGLPQYISANTSNGGGILYHIHG